MKPMTERLYKTIRAFTGPQGIKLSHQELAAQCGCSRRTIIRHIHILENDLQLITVQRAAQNSRVRNTYFLKNCHTEVPKWHTVDSDDKTLNPESKESLKESLSQEESSESINQPCDKTAPSGATIDPDSVGHLPGLAPGTRHTWIARWGADPVRQAIEDARERDGGPGLAHNFLTGKSVPFPKKPDTRPLCEQPRPPCPNCGDREMVTVNYDHPDYKWLCIKVSCGGFGEREPVPVDNPDRFFSGKYADYIQR